MGQQHLKFSHPAAWVLRKKVFNIRSYVTRFLPCNKKKTSSKKMLYFDIFFLYWVGIYINIPPPLPPLSFPHSAPLSHSSSSPLPHYPYLAPLFHATSLSPCFLSRQNSLSRSLPFHFLLPPLPLLPLFLFYIKSYLEHRAIASVTVVGWNLDVVRDLFEFCCR